MFTADVGSDDAASAAAAVFIVAEAFAAAAAAVLIVAVASSATAVVDTNAFVAFFVIDAVTLMPYRMFRFNSTSYMRHLPQYPAVPSLGHNHS